MKTIKNLTVTVTYRVGLGDVEVSDEMLKKLEAMQDSGRWNCNDHSNHADAAEWLSDNINEADAFDWEYEIDELE
jgi:hypothetical protein